MSDLFKLNTHDFVKGAVVAVLAAVFTYLASAMNAPGFDLATLDWQYLLKVAVTTFFAYSGKNLISDSQGKVLGKI